MRYKHLIVVLPDDPKRIVSLAPSITEIIYGLSQEHRLAGVTRFSDFPPEAAKLPKVGSFVQLDAGSFKRLPLIMALTH